MRAGAEPKILGQADRAQWEASPPATLLGTETPLPEPFTPVTTPPTPTSSPPPGLRNLSSIPHTSLSSSSLLFNSSIN